MGKYFGTDGVRGIANRELTPELAFKIGRCGGYVLAGQIERPTVIIGCDTRISGAMLESALLAGLLSIGADVIRVGVVTTPTIAYLTRHLSADAGVMISASHNPVEDNGIKFFGSDGFKLTDETEEAIERLLDEASDALPRPIGGALGRVRTDDELKYRYIDYLKTTVETPFTGIKIVLDCAHGAAYELAPLIFQQLGAEVIAIHAEPDGLNINDGCGSTNPQILQQEVVRHQAHIGLSFDGDADRLIAVDETGEIMDGDYVLFICGEAMKQKGALNDNTIVTTVMSNVGFYIALQENGMQSVKTAVGDRYVIEQMRSGGYNLGGEQSGHIIFLDYNTTGDGILSGLQLVQTMIQSGKKLSELKRSMVKFPQVLINIGDVNKEGLRDNEAVRRAITLVEQRLGSAGRVLVRPSGTEDLIRVMVEGPDEQQIEAEALAIADVIKLELAKTS